MFNTQGKQQGLLVKTEYKTAQKVEQYWSRLGCEIAKLVLKEKGYGFRF